MRPGALRPEGPRAARLCKDSRPGLESGLPECPESRPGRALRAPLLPQSGLKSIFHSTGPKSPRAPKPFRPPWERWGGDSEGVGVRLPRPAAGLVQSRPGRSTSEAPQKHLRKESLLNSWRGLVSLLLAPPVLPGSLCWSLRFCLRLAVCFSLSCLFTALSHSTTFPLFLPPTLLLPPPPFWVRRSSPEWGQGPNQAISLEW